MEHECLMSQSIAQVLQMIYIAEAIIVLIETLWNYLFLIAVRDLSLTFYKVTTKRLVLRQTANFFWARLKRN